MKSLSLLEEIEKNESQWWPEKNTKENSAGENEFEYQKNILRFTLESQNFSEKQKTDIFKVVAFLENIERQEGKNDTLPLRETAVNPISKQKEPRINHLLGVCILALGILEKGLHLKSESRTYYKYFKKDAFLIAITTLLHDTIEDMKGVSQEEAKNIVKKFLGSLETLNSQNIESIMSSLDFLTRKVSETGEKETVEEYLNRMKEGKNDTNSDIQKSALRANFIKNGGDIIHNTLSAHHTKKRKKKYQSKKFKGEGYTTSVFEEIPDIEDAIPQWIYERILKENPYLKRIILRNIILKQKNSVNGVLKIEK